MNVGVAQWSTFSMQMIIIYEQNLCVWIYIYIYIDANVTRRGIWHGSIDPKQSPAARVHILTLLEHPVPS